MMMMMTEETKQTPENKKKHVMTAKTKIMMKKVDGECQPVHLIVFLVVCVFVFLPLVFLMWHSFSIN